MVVRVVAATVEEEVQSSGRSESEWCQSDSKLWQQRDSNGRGKSKREIALSTSEQ